MQSRMESLSLLYQIACSHTCNCKPGNTVPFSVPVFAGLPQLLAEKSDVGLGAAPLAGVRGIAPLRLSVFEIYNLKKGCF